MGTVESPTPPRRVGLNTEKDRKGPKRTEKDRKGPKRDRKKTEKGPKRTEKDALVYYLPKRRRKVGDIDNKTAVREVFGESSIIFSNFCRVAGQKAVCVDL